MFGQQRKFVLWVYHELKLFFLLLITALQNDCLSCWTHTFKATKTISDQVILWKQWIFLSVGISKYGEIVWNLHTINWLEVNGWTMFCLSNLNKLFFNWFSSVKIANFEEFSWIWSQLLHLMWNSKWTVFFKRSQLKQSSSHSHDFFYRESWSSWKDWELINSFATKIKKKETLKKCASLLRDS